MWDTGKKRPSTVYENLEAHEGHSLIIRSVENGKMEAYCTGCGSVVFSAVKTCVGGLRTGAPAHVPAPTPVPAQAPAPAPVRAGIRTQPLKTLEEFKRSRWLLHYEREDCRSEEEWVKLYKQYLRQSVKRKGKAPAKSRVQKAWDASI